MATSDVDTVLKQIDARAAAMVAGDVEGIAALLDDRLIYTHSSGLTDSKASYLAALERHEYTYHSVRTVQVDHTIEQGGLVIVNCVAESSMTVKSTGQSLSRQIKLTEIWVDGPDGPRLLVSHSTNLA
jgi:ketosteroid isomerase-like protein